ncbi:MAG: hypothetical protein QNJ84_18480 [Alphaproteobacteria bacterium]|nr:hypothetical protein [Alphaproteobacteria bacterium]
MAPVSKKALPESLLRAVAAIEAGGAAGTGRGRLTTGFAPLDAALARAPHGQEGGLEKGSVHEFLGEAALSFLLTVLGAQSSLQAASQPGPLSLLWCVANNRRDRLYGPGLAQAGLDPGRCLIAACGDADEMLWAMEEGLRSGAVDAVVAAPAKPVSLSASRRLQLAAEEGGAVGLVLPRPYGAPPTDALLAPSAAASRWRIDPVARDAVGAAESWVALWRVSLLRRKGGLHRAGAKASEGGAGWLLGLDRRGRRVALDRETAPALGARS